MKIYPSLISADLLNLKQVVATLDQYCDGYHLDVMDDHFVPNLTFGPDIINAIAQAAQKPLHVHLMVDNPEKWPGRLKLRPGDTIIVHYETLTNSLEKVCEESHRKGWLVGLALNPETLKEVVGVVRDGAARLLTTNGTSSLLTTNGMSVRPEDSPEPDEGCWSHPSIRAEAAHSGRATSVSKDAEALVSLFAHIDMILCMTVHPGFAGQKLIPEVLAKVKDLSLLSSKISSKISIWVDGGVNLENIRQVGESGATGVAVASAIFSQKDPIEALKKLYLVAGNTK